MNNTFDDTEIDHPAPRSRWLEPAKALCEQHKLPESYLEHIEENLVPLFGDIMHSLDAPNVCSKGVPIIGVQGCQGSGKSTSSAFLKLLFEVCANKQAVVLSIDDFYLTRSERSALARDIHPLLITRGVPGTHDVTLAKNTFTRLKSLQTGEELSVPCFNKALDDRSPESEWPSVTGPIDAIIFEGWCVGFDAQEEGDLLPPVNRLEVEEDPDGVWRRYVNQALTEEYPSLFSMLDYLAVLQAPSFAAVHAWRAKQEEKLIQKTRVSGEENRCLSPLELERFISHYQRLTEHGMATLPQKADWCFYLNEDQKVVSHHNN